MTRQPVAIVGMACVFPGSPDLGSYWQNILSAKDCLREVSEKEWDVDQFYNPSSPKFKHVYVKRGGFISEYADFDPLHFGVMPKSVAGSDPDQLLALKVAVEALRDAGYLNENKYRHKAEVVLGRTSSPGPGMVNLFQHGHTIDQVLSIVSKLNPQYSDHDLHMLEAELESSLRPTNSDSIPAIMPNVIAGRIAGRLGFMGRSVILDAACASSLVALEIAVQDLRSGLSDMALTGGMHVNSMVSFYQMFCGLGALSRHEEIRPFDDKADGTMIGEGIGMVVLKRLEDAVKDGDRIYATIRGIGTASEGHGTSMLAPGVRGEVEALNRAYVDADIDPKTVSLIEGHGTGTPTGDLVELAALAEVLGKGEQPFCALGSVKSQIGHCQAASGMAGLIKVALALHEKTLPPTINVSNPNAQFDWKTSPVYINNRTRPWIVPSVLTEEFRQKCKADPVGVPNGLFLEPATPRRAGVSAFGFGGVNAHAVLEEHVDKTAKTITYPDLISSEADSELFALSATNKQLLATYAHDLLTQLEQSDKAQLKDLAYSINKAIRPADKCRAAFVASSQEELKKKLLLVSEVSKGIDQQQTSREIFFATEKNTDKMVFLLPGLGAAYPNMLSELCRFFPEVRKIFDWVDQLAKQSTKGEIPSRRIFPMPSLNPGIQAESQSTLARTDLAVVVVLMAEWALFSVLRSLGIRPDILLGLSTGEFAAISMSGAINIVNNAGLFVSLSSAVSQSVPESGLKDLRSALVFAGSEKLDKLINSTTADLYLGASLAPNQSLVSGTKLAIDTLAKQLDNEKILWQELPTAIPYHTPLVAGKIDPKADQVRDLVVSKPECEAWSCSLVGPLPENADEIRKHTTDLFTKPIRFRESIEKLYEQGARRFVEVGPKGTLTLLVGEILRGKPHFAMSCDSVQTSSITQLNTLLAALFSQGENLEFDELYKRRSCKDVLNQPVKTENTDKRNIRLPLNYPNVEISDSFTQTFQKPPASDPAPLPDTFATPTKKVTADYSAPSLALQQQADFGLDGPGEDLVIAEYLNTVSKFHEQLLRTQSEVLSSYIDNSKAFDSQPSTSSSLTFLNQGTVSTWGENANLLKLDIALSLEEHQFLKDHAIGGSVLPNSADKVFLLPLTVALELMAELASLHCPDEAIVALREVRAHRRIKVTSDERLPLTVVTTKTKATTSKEGTSEHIVSVEIRAGNVHDSAAIMSCDVVFSERYPLTPTVSNMPFGQSVKPRLAGERLYGPKAMFHGPRMQSVKELSRVAPRTIDGVVTARDAHGWFTDRANFILDPLLLDNSTQLVLFHLFEQSERVTALLPFLIDSVEFFEDIANLDVDLNVQAHLTSLSQRGTEANLEIFYDSGRVLCRFNRIASRRIILDDYWEAVVGDPKQARLASRIEGPVDLLPESLTYGCTAVEKSILPTDEVTLLWCLDYVLSEDELEYFQSQFGKRATPNNESRKSDWLLGRLAAKQAIRDLIEQKSGEIISWKDVSILADSLGKPIAKIKGVEKHSISISHKDGTAIAFAVPLDSFEAVGVDIDSPGPRDSGFEQMAFTDSERQTLTGYSGAQRDQAITFIWCAKEAAGKVLGQGLSNNPKTIEIQGLDLSAALSGTPTPAVAVIADESSKRDNAVAVTVRRLGAHCLAFAVRQSLVRS